MKEGPPGGTLRVSVLRAKLCPMRAFASSTAEGVGFEPTGPVDPALRFSRPVHSTALPPLRGLQILGTRGHHRLPARARSQTSRITLVVRSGA